MGRFFNGETDAEIAKASGYSNCVISDLTAKYWNEEMRKKANDVIDEK